MDPAKNQDSAKNQAMTATDMNGIVRVLESLGWFPETSRPTGALVVCTDLDIRLLLAHQLENLGYWVHTASSGTAAYQIGIEHACGIDLLLCDEGLADLPAPELYSSLKKRSPGLRCCVLATTKQQIRANEAARLGAIVLSLTGPTISLGIPTDLIPDNAPLEGVLSADEIRQLEQSDLTLEDAIRAIESSEG
jgi:CheY-like chemotaxis protein